ncbi:MAG: FHA domain-containing protein [Aureliella sp.]
MASAATRRRILWIDGVGGYLLVNRDEVTLGQAIVGSSADIGIVGDIRRKAGAIRRSGSDYLLQPLQATQLNGHAIERAQLLRHDDLIQFGERVQLRFTQPHPLSATARLDMVGLGKFQPHVDAVLLMADSCLIGPQANCHVRCPQWNSAKNAPLTLVRRNHDWFFNSTNELLVHGVPQRGLIAAVPGLRLCGADFSLSIE